MLYASGMAAIAGLLLAKLQAGDEVVLFNECYHRTREFCVKYLGKFGVVDAAGAGLRLSSHGSGDHAGHAAAGERIAHQSAPERRRLGAICRAGPPARRRNRDRRHAGHALQRAAAGVRRRLRGPFVHQVPGRPQRHAGRRVIGSAEKIEPLRKLRGIIGTVNAPHNIYLLLRGLKTFELRMQRHNENGQAVADSWPAIRGSKRFTIPACRAIRITRSPGGRCGVLAGW